jgi:hypothetical protein
MSMTTHGQLRECQQQALKRHNETEISRLCKKYDNNLKVTGHGMSLASYYNKEDRGNVKWRAAALRAISINTKVLKEDELLVGTGKTRTPEAGIRGIVRDMHPLGKSRSNAPIVIAFMETWFCNMIIDIVSHSVKHKLSIPATMKIEPHLPSIISFLRHEAVFARKNLIAKMKEEGSLGNKRILVTTHLKRPWVRLIEEDTGNWRVLQFEVEDYRLARPERYHKEDFEPIFVVKRKNRNQLPPSFKSGTQTEAVPMRETRIKRHDKYEWEEDIDMEN